MATLTDWAKYLTFAPSLYFRPESYDELGTLIGNVASGMFRQRRVRILGSLHSCSRVFVGDAVMDVGLIPTEFRYDNDEKTLITVSANWHLRDLLARLAKEDRSLLGTGGTNEQTMGGLISTNTAQAPPQLSLYQGPHSLGFAARRFNFQPFEA